MKKIRLAINGFGRIGRNAFKIAFDRPDIEVVGINDLGDPEVLAHLLKYDTSYGTYHQPVKATEAKLQVGRKKIALTSEPNIAKLDWKALDVDVVLECTGRFTTTKEAKKHITKAGAKRVIISAPVKDDESKMVVIGVNEKSLNKQDLVISNASCTTNCIAPIMAVIEEVFGIDKAMMTTIHAVTASQPSLDSPARDLRMSRAAAFNMIPTTTGASKATAKVIPSLSGKFDGLSVRVPVAVPSMCDFAIVLKRDTTVEEVNKVLRAAAKEPYYQGILTVTDEQLVSSDFIGNPASAVVDLPLTNLVGGNLLKLVAWYDNEWGYSNRLVELATDFGKLG